MNTFEITVNHSCLPASKRAKYDAEDIFIRIELDFVPSIGSMLKVTPHGDYLKVEDVYIDATSPEDGIEIYTDDSDVLQPWSFMKAEGWSRCK